MYYQYNGENSVTDLTNRHGDKIEQYRYDAFGNIYTRITAPYNTTGYTGKDYDDVADLVQMDARWYDPSVGRFTTQDSYFGDSYTSQSLNRYSYVMNNPVNMWDPTGHVPEWVGDQYHIVISEDKKSRDLYKLISNGTSISDYYLINTKTTDKNIIYQYEATITNTWYYDDYYLLQNTNDSTIYHVVSGPTSMTYTQTSGYSKEVTVTAAEIAGANAEYIKNLAGDPPKDTDPPAVSISTMQVGKDPVQMLDFKVNRTHIDIVGTLTDFQKSYGMATSGVVDQETIHQLISIYKHNNQYTEEVVTEVITSTEVGFQTYAGGYSQDVYKYGNYTIGNPKQPEWKEGKQYDEDFKYDPDAKATAEDYRNWVEWGVKGLGADVLSSISFGLFDLSDAVEAYHHYRSGGGKDLSIDYEKAYKEDEYIRDTVNNCIADAQKAAQELSKISGLKSFKMTGKLLLVGKDGYPVTENWQKAIGAHKIWISADVTVDDKGQFSMLTTVHEIDRYNFNKGMQDITTGTPDDVNGRFAVLGWANSFNTVGQMEREVIWTKNNIENTTVIKKPGGR